MKPIKPTAHPKRMAHLATQGLFHGLSVGDTLQIRRDGEWTGEWHFESARKVIEKAINAANKEARQRKGR